MNVATSPANVRHLAGKSNANNLTDSEIQALYIARPELLTNLIADISSTRDDAAPQHHMLIGVRGTGKSTLLRRIEAELRSPALKQRFIPLAFPEEHYQRVATDRLSDFWLNCLDALANAYQCEGQQDEAKRLDTLIKPLGQSAKSRETDESALAAACKRVLDEELTATDRRAVLLLDNFPKLMQQLPSHDWALRAWLQSQDAPLLVAASTEYPAGLADYSTAFYDSFKTRYLNRLNVDEVMTMLRHIAEREGRPLVAQQLYGQAPRLKALHALTGGSPRTVIYLYQLLVGGLSETVETDLKRLMDEVRPMYEQRLESLPEQARAVFAALALEWRPSPARRIQQITLLPAGGISGQLARLENLGHVDKVPLYGNKRTGYQITERLFNIWYLDRVGSRRDRAPVESLAIFLEAFYSPEMIANVAQGILQKNHLDDHEMVRAFATAKAMPGGTQRDNLFAQAQLAQARVVVETGKKIAKVLNLSGESLPAKLIEFAKLEKALEKCVPSQCGVNPKVFADAVIGSISMLPPNVLGKGDRLKIAATKKLSAFQVVELLKVFREEYKEFVKRMDEETVEWMQQRLLKGQITRFDVGEEWDRALTASTTAAQAKFCADLLEYSCPEQRIRALELWAERDPSEKHLWLFVGDQIQAVLKQYDRAETAYKKAIELQPSSSLAWTELGILLNNRLFRYEEAEQAFRNALKHDPDYPYAWLNLGRLLHYASERYVEAEFAYREANRCKLENSAAWRSLGRLFAERLGRYDDAEEAFRTALGIGFEASGAWSDLGDLYQDYLGRPMDARAAYDTAIKLQPEDVDARHNIVFLLRDQLADIDDARDLFDKITRDPEVADSYSLQQALFAVYAENWGDARTHFTEALKHTDFTLRARTRDDWFRACAVLCHLGLAEKFLELLEELGGSARMLPLVEAMRAQIEGSADYLLNAPAEVRPVAKSIFDEIERRRLFLPPSTKRTAVASR